MRIHRLSGSSPHPWNATFHPRLTVVHRPPTELATPLREALDALVRVRISGPELAAAGLGGRVALGDREVALEDLAEAAPGMVPARIRVLADLVDPVALLDAARAREHEVAVAAATTALHVAEARLTRAQEQWTASRRAGSARMTESWRVRGEAARALRGSRRVAVDAHEAATLADGERVDPSVPGVEEVATSRRPEPGGAIDGGARLRAELEAAERDLAGRTPATTTVEERRTLVDRKAQIDAELRQIRTTAPDRVIVALAHAERRSGFPAVEAAEVAVEWERVRELVAETTAGAARAPRADPTPGPSPSPQAGGDGRRRRARERVEAARRVLVEASSVVVVDPREVEALEAAHAEVLAAWEGNQSGDGAGRGRRRLADAQQAEREILERMGLSGYIEFLVAARAADAGAQETLDRARRELVEAEARLREAEPASHGAEPVAPSPVADEVRGRLAATLDALRSRAAHMLGEDPGSDVAGRLRERIATDPLSDLRMALDEVGLPLGEVLSRAEVLTRARAWLAQQEDRSARRAALAAARVEVDELLARLDAEDSERGARLELVRRRDELRGALAQRPSATAAVAGARASHPDDPATTGAHLGAAEEDARRRPILSPPDLRALETDARDARVAPDDAVPRLVPGGAPDEQEDAADRDLGRAEAQVLVARLGLAGLEQSGSSRSPKPLPAAGPVDVEGLVWQILARMAAQRGGPGGPGPTPLVLDEPFGSLDGPSVQQVCHALVGPAAVVQTVLVTDRREVGEWLDGADPEVAAVVDVHPADGGVDR